MATEKLEIQCIQKTYHVNVKIPFQLVFLPTACEASSRLILGFNLTYVNLTDLIYALSECNQADSRTIE